MNSQDLLPFQELVRCRSGLQLETQSGEPLMLAVRQRMAATEAPFCSAYYARVLADEAEFGELVSLLTINETYFYREPRQLELLTEVILPELLDRAGERPLRILSAGCSSGEEAYSIAIAIREKYGEDACRRVSIAACDIDRHALARARRAQYSGYSFRALPQTLRERYFSELPGNGYLLSEPIRRMVEFSALNLLSSPSGGQLRDLDVVFFRNVSIYFDAPSRERTLRLFHSALRDGGSLILGAAETLANDLGVFELREDGRGFYFVKGDEHRRPCAQARPVLRCGRAPALGKAPSVRPQPAPATVRQPLPCRSTDPALVAIVAEKIAAVDAQVRSGEFAAALDQLESLRKLAPGNVEALVLESYALLLSRRFAEAVALARRLLEGDRWSLDATVLLGLCAKWQGERAAAIDSLKRAAYIRPDCWPVHYYLGGLLNEEQPAKARREYRTAFMQMSASSNPDPDGGLRLPLNLPVADLRLLCEQRGARETPMSDRSPRRGA